jgi:hypothetical protein
MQASTKETRIANTFFIQKVLVNQAMKERSKAGWFLLDRKKKIIKSVL